jgi:hypothetical protein
MVVPREHLVEWLNSIEWLSVEEISPEAEALIADHLTKIRAVIKDVMATQSVSVVDAHRFAQTAGHNSPEGNLLLDDLFKKVVFRGAGVRLALIGTIAAGYCWRYDADLRHLPNPWLPLIDLYGMGYTTSGDDDPNGDGLSLLVGYKGGIRAYRII